jgi:predicted DNA-binding transcriptional regulator AlpA
MARLLTYDQLVQVKGIDLTKAHLSILEKAGRFPKRVIIGQRHGGWLEVEIDEFLEARIAERDAA